MNKKKIVKISAVIILAIIVIVGIIVLILIFSEDSDSDEKEEIYKRPIWGYKCEQNLCKKVDLSEVPIGVGFEVCRLFCSGEIGTLWPKPSGQVKFKSTIGQIDPRKIKFDIGDQNVDYWPIIKSRFEKQIENKIPEDEELRIGGKVLNVKLLGLDKFPEVAIIKQEEYSLTSHLKGNEITVTITSSSYFGVRHGLETLAQLIIYDELEGMLKIPSDVEIFDGPKFEYRGFSLDTSRNFFSTESIKKTIDAMAMVKMNVFHWHITDSNSFPIEINSQPHLSKFGAYSKKKTYRADDVKEIVKFAAARGIEIIPEFVIPAHVGEGWQGTNLTTCFNIQPWSEYCSEAPCGQLDPSKSEVYDVLEDIFRELLDMFGNVKRFHFGEDDVSFKCWNTSVDLQGWMLQQKMTLDDEGFLKLWEYFHERAMERFEKVSKSEIPIIMWQNKLVNDFPLSDRKKYIVQLWRGLEEPQTKSILEKGYSVILSNYDALYLDCGFGSWNSDGNNWCTPYKSWHTIYENKIEDALGDYSELALGAEAHLWGQQVDDNTIDYKVWPRLSALAERLWTNPKAHWRTAEPRLLMNFKRLVENGIGADRLQPDWCLQNEAECPF